MTILLLFFSFSSSILVPILVILYAHHRIQELEATIAAVSKQLNYIKDHTDKAVE